MDFCPQLFQISGHLKYYAWVFVVVVVVVFESKLRIDRLKFYRQVCSSISKPRASCNDQKQPPEVFYKKVVLRNFTKFTGKHLCFLIKLQASCLMVTAS